jgi:hypothetical protein
MIVFYTYPYHLRIKTEKLTVSYAHDYDYVMSTCMCL